MHFPADFDSSHNIVHAVQILVYTVAILAVAVLVYAVAILVNAVAILIHALRMRRFLDVPLPLTAVRC